MSFMISKNQSSNQSALNQNLIKSNSVISEGILESEFSKTGKSNFSPNFWDFNLYENGENKAEGNSIQIQQLLDCNFRIFYKILAQSIILEMVWRICLERSLFKNISHSFQKANKK